MGRKTFFWEHDSLGSPTRNGLNAAGFIMPVTLMNPLTARWFMLEEKACVLPIRAT